MGTKLRSIRQFGHTMREAVETYRHRKSLAYLVNHHRPLTLLPPRVALPLLCGPVKGKLRKPAELTILTIHNYAARPILERSLHYAGISDYVVLSADHEGPWYDSIKLKRLHSYLQADGCQTEYLLFLDAEDCVLCGEPGRAIDLMHEQDCELLMSDTDSQAGYECMPQVKQQVDRIAAQRGAQGRYPCTGVFVGRTQFIRELVAAAMAYVTDHDLTREQYRYHRRAGDLCKQLPEFPRGIGCDQIILRYLQPRFHPRFKLDARGELAYRR
jgi:hypothetical protein